MAETNQTSDTVIHNAAQHRFEIDSNGQLSVFDMP